MNLRMQQLVRVALVGALGLWIGVRAASAQDDPAVAEIKANVDKYSKAFNAGKAADVAVHFAAQGELVDDEGIVYQGRKEIEELLTAYFKKFPGAKLNVNVETVRVVGPVAIEEGTRTLSTESAGSAQLRYITTWAKVDKGWQIASLRDFSDDPLPSPNELLQPLAWLVGDWMSEGSEAVVKISYRWSEDKNFLLGDFLVTNSDKVIMKSSQRIGWDPIVGKVRSWVFDSDGGFGEGSWTQVGEEWVIKSTAVLPDGQSGSATVTFTPKGPTRYTLKGTERIIGNEREKDFEVTVVRQPPKSQK